MEYLFVLNKLKSIPELDNIVIESLEWRSFSTLNFKLNCHELPSFAVSPLNYIMLFLIELTLIYLYLFLCIYNKNHHSNFEEDKLFLGNSVSIPIYGYAFIYSPIPFISDMKLSS